MDPAQEHLMRFFSVMMPLMFLFGVLIVALIIVPLWRICTKAGLAGPLSLLALIPGFGWLVAVYVIAFSDWKVVPLQSFAYPPPYLPPQHGVYPPQNGPFPGPPGGAFPPQPDPLPHVHPHAHHVVESFPAAGYPPPPPPAD